MYSVGGIAKTLVRICGSKSGGRDAKMQFAIIFREGVFSGSNLSTTSNYTTSDYVGAPGIVLGLKSGISNR